MPTDQDPAPPSLSDTDIPLPDAAWNQAQRHETPTQRLDRNWVDLLQELRVVQTGVQLLTGFLLTLPFQQRFADLDGFAHTAYLVTVCCSVAATGFLISPVALHRALFRQHARRRMVATGQVLALTGMALLAAAVTGVMLLIFDVLLGRAIGIVAGAVALALLVVLWLVLPLATRIALEGSKHRPPTVTD
jgi:MFS family permease